MADLPPVRRVVTGHDAAGRAILRSDDRFDAAIVATGDAAFSLIWTTPTVPADNNDDTDGRLHDAGLTLNHGSVIRIVDMLPGGASPMHRTDSVDYGIILSGAGRAGSRRRREDAARAGRHHRPARHDAPVA